jgi:hypothetical protein
MSKIGCTCGHVIRDQTDNLTYKGQILKDQDKEAVLEGIASDVTAYIEGLLTGNRDEWDHRFPWLRGQNHGAVVWGIITQYCLKYPIDIYECEQCGRVWVQKAKQSQEFDSFAPDLQEVSGVLKSEQFGTSE